jgi:hypothetical protein
MILLWNGFELLHKDTASKYLQANEIVNHFPRSEALFDLPDLDQGI